MGHEPRGGAGQVGTGEWLKQQTILAMEEEVSGGAGYLLAAPPNTPCPSPRCTWLPPLVNCLWKTLPCWSTAAGGPCTSTV